MNKKIIASLALALLAFGGLHYIHYSQYEIKEASYKIEDSKYRIGSAPDFSKIDDTTSKKKAFFNYIKPGVELENAMIMEDRRRIINAKSNLINGGLVENDRKFINEISKKYAVDYKDEIDENLLNSLLEKVDIIPVSLVLVQAANESAWGTSRFAKEGNNYFGQWCFKSGCGLIPSSRTQGMNHEVAKFPSVQDSIRSYLLNVNRNKAYKHLRKIRAIKRSLNEDVSTEESAMMLITGLTNYSERGQEYVEELQSMLRHNSKFFSSDKNPDSSIY